MWVCLLPTFASAQSTFEARADYILDWVCSDWPNTGQYDGPHRIGRTGFWYTEGRLYRNTATNAIWTILSDAIRNADGMEDANGGNGGFSGWPGMDCYLRYNHLMPQWILDKYKTEYTTMPAYHQGATANQQMMWGVACRLACETWGTDLVTQYSHADYKHFGDPSAGLWLKYQLKRIKNSNYIEHNANHYLWASLGPVRTLMDFTTDPELRKMARHAWFYGVANAAPAWLDGHWCITYARGGWGGDQNTYDVTSFTWWLLFGSPTPYSALDSEQSLQYTMPKFEGTLPELLHAATNRTQTYTYRSFAHVQRGYYKQSYMAPGYGLYSQVEAIVGENSDGTFDFQYPSAPSGEYQATRSGLRWDDPSNGDSMIAIGAPTVWGTAVSGISPYEYTLQHEDTLIGVVDIPTNYYQYVRQHFPKTYSAIIDQSSSKGRLFLHYPTVLVSVYMTKGFDQGSGSTTIDKGAFAIETACPDEYPQATASERLNAFYTDIMTKGGVNTNFIADAPNRFVYTNRNGRVLDLTYGQVGIVDGSPVNYESWPMMESPWVNMRQGGNLFITGPDRTILFDFQDWTEHTNNRPRAVASPSTNTVAGQPIDIDLAQRVTDSETPATNLHFRVLPAAEGLSELLPDGHTMRFTPAAQRAGLSTIAFSSIDQGMDQRLIFYYDFEQAQVVSNKTVQDVSRNAQHATANTVALGTAQGDDTRPALRGAPNSQALRLSSSAMGSAKLSRRIYPSQLVLANDSWTFATWFKRADFADDDVLFYVGNSDGFSGGGDELHVHCPAQSKTVAVSHYSSSNTLDVSISSSAVIDTNAWHHIALSFERVRHNTGNVTFYVDGLSAGTVSNVTWELKQSGPVYIGGPASSTMMPRDFNGWIDETVLCRGVLTPDEIIRLTEASASYLGGLQLASTVEIGALIPPSTPTGLTASNEGFGNLLTWSEVSDATSYTIKRGLAGSGPFSILASGLLVPSYMDSGAGTSSWFYVVSASSAIGESSDSVPVQTALPAVDPTIWQSGTMAAWSHGTRLSFSNLVEGSTALTNFPLLVRLGPEMPGFSYTQFASPTGADLRFTDAAGTNELPYEIDVWNTNGTSSVWVRVPVLSTSTNICAFWGNPTANRQTASPDSISGLQLWLKADAITGLSDGATVNAWTNSINNGTNATRTAGTPTYRTNVLNGKPVVRFTTDGESYFTFPQMTDIRTVFWVVKETSTNNYHFLLGDDDKYHFHRDLNGKIWSSANASANIRNGSTRLMGDIVNGTTTSLGTGFRLVSVVTAGNVEASRLCKDRTIAARSWDGDIAEVVIYNRALTEDEEQRVRLHLAEKYALSSSMKVFPPSYTTNGTVWSQQYLGVWHLGETSGAHRDSSLSQASSELVQVTQQGSAAGVVGGTDKFDGTDDYVDLPSMGWATNVTVECWTKLDGVPATTTHGLVSSDPWSTGIAHFRTDNSLGLNVALSSSGSISQPGILSTGSWFYAAYTVAGAGSSGLALYLDGVRLATAAGTTSNNLTDVNIAREYDGRYLKGWVDEVRISSVARSAAWLLATWRNMADYTRYVRLSTVSDQIPAIPVLAVEETLGVTATNALLRGTLLSTGTVSEVKVYWGPTDGGVVVSAWSNAFSLGPRGSGGFSTNVTGLLPGTICFARFWATNSVGGAWSPTEAVFATKPSAPAALASASTNGVVSLVWSGVAGVTNYTLLRSTILGGPYSPLLEGIQTTNALDLTADAGSTFYYVARSVKYGETSTDSSAVAVTPVATPTGLIASPGNGAVSLAWNAVPGATGYTVNRATAAQGPYSVVQSGISSASYTDTGRSNGTRYWYTVQTTTTGFASQPCDAVSAVPQSALSAPAGLAATPLDVSARLAWNTVPDASSYNLKRGSSAVGPFTTVASGLLVPPRTDTGLVNGTTYYYVVSAVYGTSESTNSAPVSVAPAVPPTVFTTASAGAWSGAVWVPSLPWAGFTTKIILTNTLAVASTNNLGPFLLNALILTNQAVTLRGELLFLAGTSPSIRTVQSVAHAIELPLYLDSATTFTVPGGTLTLGEQVEGQGSVTKAGTGTLVFSQPNAYVGATTLDGGTVVCGLGPSLLNGLAFGVTNGSPTFSALTLSSADAVASTLTVRNNSTTANTLTIGSGRMLSVGGNVEIGTYAGFSGATAKLTATGGGTLALTANGASMRLGTTSDGSSVTATADLSGLSRFDMQELNTLTLGNGGGAATLTLATNSTLRAGTIKLADYQVNEVLALLKLGRGTNMIFADQLSLGTGGDPYGGGRGDGTIQFETSAGTLLLRSLDEVSGAELLLGCNGTGGHGSGVFNVSGHSCDIWLRHLMMGQSSNLRSGQSFSFDRGLLRIDTAEIAVAQTSTLSIGGGMVTYGQAEPGDEVLAGMGSFSLSGAGAGTLSITGGTNTFFCPLLKSGTGVATLTLNGTSALLDMQGFDVGTNTLPINTFTFTAGTLRDVGCVHGGIVLAGTGRRTFEQHLFAGSVTGLVSGVAGLLKNGTNTLSLTAANTYSGTTAIDDGTLAVASVADTTGSAIGLATNVSEALTFSNGGTLLFTGTSGDTARTLRSDAGGGMIDVPTAATLALNPDNLTASSTVAGWVGDGGLTKRGGGTLSLGNNRSGSADRLNIGSGNGGDFTLEGGTLRFAPAKYLTIGESGTGHFLMTGGTATFLPTGGDVANNDIYLANVSSTATGRVTVAGGTFYATNTLTKIRVGQTGTGFLTIGGGTTAAAVVTPKVTVGSGGSSCNGTLTILTNGTLTVGSIVKTAGTASLILSGGTLQASADQTAFLAGLNAATILEGGATLDSAGFAVTVGQNLAGEGTLTKVGAGTLTLSGANTYAGGTVISNGTLQIASTGRIAATNLMVAAGAVCALRNTGDGLNDLTTVSLAGSAQIDLGTGVNETVSKLLIDGVMQASGTWNATRDPVHFTGSGDLVIVSGMPVAPTNLIATAGTESVALSWSASANATGYIVRRATAVGGPFSDLATTVSPGYDDASAAIWTRYWYVVAATNVYGIGPESVSADARITSTNVTLTASDALNYTSFDAAGRWNSGAAPQAGSRYFTGPYWLRTPTNASYTSLTFAGDGLTLNGNGGTLIFKGEASGGTTLTINQLVLDGGLLRNGVNNPWTLAGTALVKADSLYGFYQTTTTTLAANLSGTGGLLTTNTVTGDTLVLSGMNSGWSGGLTYNGGGKLALNSATAPGTGLFTIGTRDGAAVLDNTSGSDLVLSTAMPQRWAGDFTFPGTKNIDLGSGAVTLTAGCAVTVTAGTLAVGGAIGDGGNGYGLIKNSLGMLVLAGNSSYGGATTLNAGELRLRHASALGNGTDVSVASGARLVLDNSITVSGKTAAIAGTGSDDGSYFGALRSLSGNNIWNGPVLLTAAATRIGAVGGTLEIAGPIGDGASTFDLLIRNDTGTTVLSGANTYKGQTQILNGCLRLGAGNTLPATSVVRFGVSGLSANLDMNAYSQTVGGLTVAASSSGYVTNTSTTAATLTVNPATNQSCTASLRGPIALVKSGSAVWTLAANNTYTNNTTISGGTLVAAVSQAFGPAGQTVTLSDGTTLGLATDTSIAAYALNMASGNTATTRVGRATSGSAITHTLGNMTLGNSTFTVEAGDNIADGTPTLSLSSLALSAGSTGQGTATLSPNTAHLIVTGDITRPGTQANSLTLAGSMTSNLVQGAVSGALNIVKTGSGDWTLGGADTYTGTLTVSDGTLTLADAKSGTIGTVTVGNQPGINATLRIQNGSYALGTSNFNVGNATTTAMTGTVIQTGGTVSFTSGNALLIGQNSVANRGNYTLTNGSILSFGSASRGIMLGVNTGSSGGTFNLGGTGAIKLTTESGATGDGTLQVGRYDSAAHNTVNQFNQAGGMANIGYFSVGGNGTTGTNIVSSVNLTGGTFVAKNFPRLAAGNTNVATIAIGGTADVTLPTFPAARGIGATASLLFDGGTLRPPAASASYLQGLTLAAVKNGGITFDVPASRDITVAQALLQYDQSTGGLIKTGTGMLTLSGVNTYAGSTVVSNGTLQIASTGRIASSNLMVAAGAVCSLRNTGDGLNDLTTVALTGSALIDLGTDVNETVSKLVIDGVVQVSGVWNAARDAVHFTGSGNLVVLSGSPSQTTGLTATGGDTQVSLAWNVVTNSTGYEIRRSAVSGSGYALVATSATAAWTDTGLVNGMSYYYVVAATNAFGSGAASAEATATPLPAPGDGTWIRLTDGVWSDWHNWADYRVAGGVDRRAVFGGTGVRITQDIASLSLSNLLFTVNGYVVEGNPLTLAVSAGTPSITVSNGTSQIIAPLAGSEGLAKEGPGTLRLDGANTFSGDLTINGGTLLITNSVALGSGNKTFINTSGLGRLELDAAAGPITLGSGITFNISGTQAGGSIRTVAGNTTISGQVGLTTGAGNSLIVGDGGTLTLTGTVRSITSSARTLTLAGSSPATNVVSGPIINGSSAFSLTKSGIGTWLLSNAANTYTGVTAVVGGKLIAQSSTAFGGTTGGTSVSGGGTVDLGGNLASAALNLGAEIITIAGAGVGNAGALVNNGVNDQINAVQKLVLGDHATVGGVKRWDVRGTGNSLDMASKTLTKTGPNMVGLVGTAISNPGHVDVKQGSLGLHTAGNLGGTSANTMTVRAGAAVDFYNNTGSKPWTLILEDGAVTTSNGGSTWAGPCTLSGTNGGTFTVNSGHSFTLSGAVGEASAGRALIKSGAGTLTLSAEGSHSGPTLLSAGTLTLSHTSALARSVLDTGTSGTRAVTFGVSGVHTFGGLAGSLALANAGNTFRLDSATNAVYSGNLGGTGGLIKTGSGTQTLSGSNSYEGGTSVQNGTLKIAAAGALPPAGAVTLAAGATLDLTGGSPVSGPATAASLASVNGTLRLSAADRLAVQGNMSGIFTFFISDPENLNPQQTYILATFLGDPPDGVALSGLSYPWIIKTENGMIKLLRSNANLIILF